jgi:hypothetical protein
MWGLLLGAPLLSTRKSLYPLAKKTQSLSRKCVSGDWKGVVGGRGQGFLLLARAWIGERNPCPYGGHLVSQDTRGPRPSRPVRDGGRMGRGKGSAKAPTPRPRPPRPLRDLGIRSYRKKSAPYKKDPLRNVVLRTILVTHLSERFFVTIHPVVGTGHFPVRGSPSERA